MKLFKLPKLSSNPAIYIIALCIILVIASWFVSRYVNQMPLTFDKNKWLNERFPDYSTRYRMVKDLTRQYRLVGMTRTDIIGLLGEPDNFSSTNQNEMQYCLQEKYSTDIDPVSSDHLVLYFDETGRLRGYKINHYE
jgi:hypothetical protein